MWGGTRTATTERGFVSIPSDTAVTPKTSAPRQRDLKAIDFWISVALIGDTVAILLSQLAAFWVKFRSAWLPFGIETPDMQLHHYVRLIAIGTMFLLSTFGFLRLYSSRNLLSFRDVGMIQIGRAHV